MSALSTREVAFLNINSGPPLHLPGVCAGEHAKHFTSPCSVLTTNSEVWCVQSLSHVWFFAPPWTVAYQPPLLMDFSRQEYWSGLPCPPPPGDLPNPRIKPGYSALQASTLPLSHQGRPVRSLSWCLRTRQEKMRVMPVHKVGNWWHLIQASSPPVHTPHRFSSGCWTHFINSLSGVACLNISHVWRISTVVIQVCSVQTYILLLNDCSRLQWKSWGGIFTLGSPPKASNVLQQ